MRKHCKARNKRRSVHGALPPEQRRTGSAPKKTGATGILEIDISYGAHRQIPHLLFYRDFDDRS
jgi:hypothetical protein